MVNNSTNINKVNNHLSSQLIDHKKIHGIWHCKYRSCRGIISLIVLLSSVCQSIFYCHLQPYSRATSGTVHRHQNSERHTQSAHSGAISSSVHDLSPTLWHALDVWRCTNHLGGGLAEALQALATCGMGLSNENW